VQLGEGGSGDVYQATILNVSENFSCYDKQVALKKAGCLHLDRAHCCMVHECYLPTWCFRICTQAITRHPSFVGGMF